MAQEQYTPGTHADLPPPVMHVGVAGWIRQKSVFESNERHSDDIVHLFVVQNCSPHSELGIP